MRMTTLLKKLLGIQHVVVTGFDIEDGALVIEVRPSWRTPRCSGCTTRRGRYDTLHPRRWHTMPSAPAVVKRAGGTRRTSVSQSSSLTGHFFRLHLRPWCRGRGHNRRIFRKLARPAGLA